MEGAAKLPPAVVAEAAPPITPADLMGDLPPPDFLSRRRVPEASVRLRPTKNTRTHASADTPTMVPTEMAVVVSAAVRPGGTTAAAATKNSVSEAEGELEGVPCGVMADVGE